MIKLENLTPKIYYAASRDFQLIGRLYDTVLNSVKTNSELIYSIPLSENSDSRLIDLMAATLGFKSRHKYNTKQLLAICSVFSVIIKQKGTLQAIETACKALLVAEGITEDVFVEIDSSDRFVVNIYIPQVLSDINLLQDLLYYILPAGMSCNIIKELRESKKADIKFGLTAKSTVWDNTNTAWAPGTSFSDIEDTTVSIVPELSDDNLRDVHAKGTPGIFINSTIVQPEGLPRENTQSTNSANTEDENE